MIEQGIRRHLYLMKMNVWIVGIHANWRRIADKMHVVSARRQLHPQLRSHHARSPVRGITSYSDAHAPLFSAFLSVLCVSALSFIFSVPSVNSALKSTPAQSHLSPH